jgi:hypothetical protein
MCDFSLELKESRPAKLGEKLISTGFPNTFTRGFAARDDTERRVAVCLLPGTELAFPEEVKVYRPLLNLRRSTEYKVARFRQVNQGESNRHHDALEFPDGKICLLTQICEGQEATVLQLPVTTSTVQDEPITGRRSTSLSCGEGAV